MYENTITRIALSKKDLKNYHLVLLEKKIDGTIWKTSFLADMLILEYEYFKTTLSDDDTFSFEEKDIEDYINFCNNKINTKLYDEQYLEFYKWVVS